MPRHGLSRSVWIVLILAVAMVALPVAARADSLVFVRDSNVWLANADGSGQYQVTLDGTAANPYESPSQADDGTILAIRQPPGQRNQLFRMTQNGGLRNPPINTPAPGPGGASDARISPDGRLVASWFVTTVNDPVCLFCVSLASQALLSYADRFTNAQEIGTPNMGQLPSWMSNDTVLLSDGGTEQWYYTLGTPEARPWFADSNFVPMGFQTLIDGEVSRDGTRIALVRGNNYDTIVLTLTKPGTATVKATFTRAAKRALKRRRSVALVAQVTVADLTGHATTKAMKLTLRR